MGIYVHIHNIYFHNEKHIGSLRTKRKISESMLMKNPVLEIVLENVICIARVEKLFILKGGFVFYLVTE